MITKAMLAPGGILEKKVSRVSKPPADAPMPTIEKLVRILVLFPSSFLFLETLLVDEVFFTLVGMVSAFQLKRNEKKIKNLCLLDYRSKTKELPL